MADPAASAAAREMFVCKRTPTIMDGLVFRWQVRGQEGLASPASPGEISASRNGVMVSGYWPLFRDAGQGEVFAEVLEQAFSTFSIMSQWSMLQRPEGFEPPGWAGHVLTPEFGRG